MEQHIYCQDELNFKMMQKNKNIVLKIKKKTSESLFLYELIVT